MHAGLQLLLSLAAQPAAGHDGPANAAHLAHGPLVGGTARVFDLRTQSPHAPVLVFRAGQGGAYVPADPALPALGVVPGTVALHTHSDARGRVRVVLPTALGQFSAGTSFFQALVRAADGRWERSDCAAVRREPAAPTGGWLTEISQPLLPPSAANLGAHAVLAQDLDRDGDRELVLAHATGVALWIDEAAAGFADSGAARLPHPAVPASALASTDVDRDGDVDLFTAGVIEGGHAWPDRLWLNDGLAAFAQDPAFPPGDGATSGAEFGDVDGDGDPDLAIARGSDGHAALVSPCQLYRNLAGRFSPDAGFAQAAWNDGIAPAPAVRFGDVDDDGDLDLFVARSDVGGVHGGPGERNVLLVNDGSGVFADESALRFAVPYDDNSLDAAFVDVDLDGDLDLAVANSVAGLGPALSGDLWINQGGAQAGVAGWYVEDANSPLESFDPAIRIRLAVRPGDLDADGDMDLLVLVHDLPPTSRQLLLVNQGGAQGGLLGRFERAPWFDVGALIGSDAALLDRDHDGLPETVVTATGTLSGDPATSARVIWLETHFP